MWFAIGLERVGRTLWVEIREAKTKPLKVQVPLDLNNGTRINMTVFKGGISRGVVTAAHLAKSIKRVVGPGAVKRLTKDEAEVALK